MTQNGDFVTEQGDPDSEIAPLQSAYTHQLEDPGEIEVEKRGGLTQSRRLGEFYESPLKAPGRSFSTPTSPPARPLPTLPVTGSFARRATTDRATFSTWMFRPARSGLDAQEDDAGKSDHLHKPARGISLHMGHPSSVVQRPKTRGPQLRTCPTRLHTPRLDPKCHTKLC